MKNRKKIGIFGGSFDPCHNAHISLAQDVLKKLHFDKILLMPAYIQPFKEKNNVTSADKRVAMLNLAIKELKNIDITTIEIDKNEISYTYNSLCKLQEIYFDSDIYFIMGADSLFALETWYKGSEMLQKFSFVVAKRPGCDEKKLQAVVVYLQKKYNSNILQIDNEQNNISSTEIREKIAHDEDISHLVPFEVERYIKENGLYK